MSLSILCVTNNEHSQVEKFIVALRGVADRLKAELVLGLDREKAQRAEWRRLADVRVELQADKLQEDVLDLAVEACSGNWVLRLDDDETISRALETWLGEYRYIFAGSQLYAFPRVYLYPDEYQFIINAGMWPDLQTRLGLKHLMKGYTYVHAGNPNGTGRVVPYAIEHHKLLVRSLEERRAIAARYEALRPGAGSAPEYARYNLPEDFYPVFRLNPYQTGNFEGD